VLAHPAWEQHGVFQARERVLVIGCRSSHAHKAERAPWIALKRPGLLAVTDDFIAELELVLGEPEACEIVIDQHGHGLAEIRRRLSWRQQHVVAVEGWKGEPVAGKLRGRDDAVRLKFIAEQAQVETLIQPVSLRRTQNECVRLLVRPVRHVGRANVSCKYLRTGDLRDAVNTKLRAAGCCIPLNRRQDFFFK
jgi:hypothetical protein